MSTAAAIASLFDTPVPQGEKRYVDHLPPPPVPSRPVKDRVLAHHVTEDAIERNCIDEAWREAAMGTIQLVALFHELLTSDDIWEAMENEGGTADQNPSALGPCIRAAVKRGWIEGTGTYRVSERPETHRRPLRVWKSRIWEGLPL